MAIDLTGMASGLDTESIVAQLMALEQNKVTAVQRRQVARPAAQGRPQRRSRPSSTRSRPRRPALAETARGRPSRPPTSSDPTKVDVALLGGAGIGGHAIEVTRLASSAQRGFDFASNAAAGSLTSLQRRGLDPGDDPRRRERDCHRHRGGRQRQRGLAGLRRGHQGPGRNEQLVFSSRTTGQGGDFTVNTSALGAGQLTANTNFDRPSRTWTRRSRSTASR